MHGGWECTPTRLYRTFAMRTVMLAVLGALLVAAVPAQLVSLHTVAGLEKPLTIRATRLTLADVVRQVAAATGVPLGVAREIEQEKLTVFVSAKPAWQLLQHIARLLELEWREDREKGGYYLVRPAAVTEKARRAQEAQAAETRRRIEQALHQWQQQAQTDFIALRNQLEQLEKQTASLESSRPDGWQDQLTALAHRRAQILPCAESLPAYLIGWLTARFGREQWSRFWQGLPFLAIYPQRGSALELPSATLAWFAAQQSSKLQGAPIQSVSLLFYLRQGTLHAYLIARAPSEQFVHPARFPFGDALAPTATGKVVNALPERKIERKPDEPELSCPYYGGVCTLAEWLEWLAARCDVPVVAESFRLPLRRASLPRGTNLADWLQQLAQQEPVEIRFDEGFLVIRYTDSWRWRLSEIGESVLAPFERRAAEQGGLSLDDYAELANLLTPAQQARLEQPGWIALRFDPAPLQQGIPILRFWANLTPAQKQAARERQPLKYEQLTYTQQRLFWDALEWGLVNPQLLAPQMLDRIDDLYAPEASAALAFFLDDWKQNTYRVSNGEFTAVFDDEESYRQSLPNLPVGARPYTTTEEFRHTYMFHFGFDSQHAIICPVVIEGRAAARAVAPASGGQ